MNQDTILVVEDDADVRLGYQVMLEANGYKVVFADDYDSAQTGLSTYLPDLVVMDLGLPGKDGFDVMQEYDCYVFLVPVIVVSARDPAGNRERALKAGARAYVQKPWNDDDLLRQIRELLDEYKTLNTPVDVVG